MKRALLESGLELLVKEYEKNPSYGHTRMQDNMVPSALRALGTKIMAFSSMAKGKVGFVCFSPTIEFCKYWKIM